MINLFTAKLVQFLMKKKKLRIIKVHSRLHVPDHLLPRYPPPRQSLLLLPQYLRFFASSSALRSNSKMNLKMFEKNC